MPFDGTNFQPEGEKPHRASTEERVFGVIFVVVVLALLLMPISMASLVDIVHFLHEK